MVQATFTVSGNDLTSDVFEQIKQFVNGSERDLEVFIRIKDKEPREQMRRRIEQSAAKMERRENVISFSGEEFENFLETLSTNEKHTIEWTSLR